MTLPANQKLEDLFDMTSRDHVVADEQDIDPAEAGNDIQNNLPILPETLATLDRIESALPLVRGLEASDSEMDDLAARASESFDDLMSLGMQVDSRYASEIFAVASTMLGHAITAKTAKMNKKLKMIDLQLKKARLDQTQDNQIRTPTGQGRVLNRNELLRTLLERDVEKTQADK
jgi:vancomycin resistance protein YoaR